MTISKHQNVSHFYFFLSLSALICTPILLHADLTSLAKNDPYPVFSTLNLDDALLLTAEQMRYKNIPDFNKKKSRGLFSISPFTQNADKGKSIEGQPCRTTFPASCPDINLALGDLGGRSSMLGLLYGRIPAGNNNIYPGGMNGYLANAAGVLFPEQLPGTITDEQWIDPEQLFGYFSFYLNYRKRGVAFELGLRLYNDFGLRVQTRVSSIRQVVEYTVNLTDAAQNFPTSTTVTAANVNATLMLQLDNIAQQMNLDIGSQNQASVEEVRLNLFWRHAFEINNNENTDWAQFLLIPYFQASASASPGVQRKPNELFAAPFGNNGHWSTGCTAGMNFDFPDTIEFGGEVGFTHFFKRSYCNFPVPNSRVQTTMFPFQTNVSIQPGNNWHFGARIATYHFIESLSMCFEWYVIDHKQDKICLETPDDAFLPKILEKRSTFKSKLGNVRFNYDLSPNIGLGFLWQIPFSQRNTYRSSTIMAGVNITF